MKWTRRRFLVNLAALTLTGGRVSIAADSSAVPRFSLLYSNDMTNLITCISPFHARGAPVDASTIRASVDEAAVADAQILQPGLGWVALWRSRSSPVEDHIAWFAARNHIPPEKIPNDFLRYMLAGGDVLGDFVTHCRRIGRHPIASLRLNDVQVMRNYSDRASRNTWISRFYVEHPEYRLGPPLRGIEKMALDWTIPEVRAAKRAFIEEMIDGYDVAGIELDFMRTPAFFRQAETTADQRRDIMTDFVAGIRDHLDRKTGGRPRLALCLRVPAVVDFHDALGLDVARLAEAGVDLFTLSNSLYTSQRADIETFRQAAPRAQHFVEATHIATTAVDPDNPRSPNHVRTTDLQFLSTASEVADRGGDGLALFNFAYFRTQIAGDTSAGGEPPFYLFPQLAQPSAIPPGPRWWFVAQGWGKGPAGRDDWLPRLVSARQPLDLRLYCQRPASDGVLRLRSRQSLAGADLAVEMEGHPLKRIEAPTELYVPRNSTGIGEPDFYAHYACPADVIRSGFNRIRCRTTGDRRLIVACDLVFPR